MRISERSTDDVTVLDLLTPLTGDNSRQLFQPQIEALLQEGKRNFVLNLREMNWLNSSGVGSLVAIHRRVAEHNGRIVLAEPNARVKEIMKVLGMTTIWKSYPTVEEAVTSFHAH